MHAQRHVLSMGRSSDSLVCHPCRQDLTRVVADPSHTPRLERGRTNSKSPSCVLNCTALSFAHATIISSGMLPPDIKFTTHPLPTPTPLCKHHYHAVYGVLQTRQRNCRICGRRLHEGNDRPCPEPEVVQAYLYDHTYFIGDVAKNPMKDHLHPKAQDNILPITICCMHASMPPKRTSRRLRGYPPESQERVKVGSTDEEASPPPGCARVDYAHIDDRFSRESRRLISANQDTKPSWCVFKC